MDDNKQDPNLQSPQEANTTKHINFMEVEENAGDTSADNAEPLKDDDSPTRKQWEEMRKEMKEDDSVKE